MHQHTQTTHIILLECVHERKQMGSSWALTDTAVGYLSTKFVFVCLSVTLFYLLRFLTPAFLYSTHTPYSAFFCRPQLLPTFLPFFFHSVPPSYISSAQPPRSTSQFPSRLTLGLSGATVCAVPTRKFLFDLRRIKEHDSLCCCNLGFHSLAW